jgi:hypothetical protein
VLTSVVTTTGYFSYRAVVTVAADFGLKLGHTRPFFAADAAGEADAAAVAEATAFTVSESIFGNKAEMRSSIDKVVLTLSVVMSGDKAGDVVVGTDAVAGTEVVVRTDVEDETDAVADVVVSGAAVVDGLVVEGVSTVVSGCCRALPLSSLRKSL